LITEGILEILPKSIVLEEEEASENLELVECRWKDNLTFPSVYWVIFLIWTLGWGGGGSSGGAAPSRIQSSNRDMSFHWIVFGTTVFEQDESVCSRSVSPFWDWNLCLLAKAENMALLASARTEEEYLQIVQGIIQSQDPETVLSQSNSSGSTSPAISLGNDNEDDCFGILPSITRH